MKKQLLLLTAGAALFGGWLLCIAPNTGRKKKMKPFEDTLIAHRGLFDNDTDAPENSIPAFRKAVESGFGIELDVQMPADGRLAVIRGQLAENFFRSDIRMAAPLKLVLSNLLINSLSRPDFIAYNFEHANQISLRLCRRLYGAETFAWVVRVPGTLQIDEVQESWSPEE